MRPARLIAAALLIAAAAPDPLAGYYDNTLVALGPAGDDQGHVWLEPDRFIQFGGPHPARAGATTRSGGQICFAPMSTTIAIPPDFAAPAPPDRLAACLALHPHEPGDRWTEAGQRWQLRPGQQ
jgi:hypothetical protein